QRLPVAAIVGEDAHAGRHSDMHRAAVDLEAAAQRRKNALDDRVDRRARIERGQYHDELVSAEPRHDVRLAYRRADPARELGDHAIAGVVPERVVDRLEAIEIDHHQREPPAARRGGGERLAQTRAQSEAIVEPRERIVISEEGDALLGAFAIGDVLDHGPHELCAVARGDANTRDLHRNARAILARELLLHGAETAASHELLEALALRFLVLVENGIPPAHP